MSLRRLSLIAFCTLIALPLIAETRVQVASAHPRINGAAPSVDLLALKEGPSTVFAGRQITYTIDVFSYGPSPAIDVTLNDTIPAGTTFASLTAPNG
ncbi:MAG: hypothetical protein QOI58_1318 [Thermoanaerobaculia bacterium]|nr:hypothetical protein [Thermoanaerobaculia bacterium]